MKKLGVLGAYSIGTLLCCSEANAFSADFMALLERDPGLNRMIKRDLPKYTAEFCKQQSEGSITSNRATSKSSESSSSSSASNEALRKVQQELAASKKEVADKQKVVEEFEKQLQEVTKAKDVAEQARTTAEADLAQAQQQVQAAQNQAQQQVQAAQNQAQQQVQAAQNQAQQDVQAAQNQAQAAAQAAERQRDNVLVWDNISGWVDGYDIYDAARHEYALNPGQDQRDINELEFPLPQGVDADELRARIERFEMAVDRTDIGLLLARAEASVADENDGIPVPEDEPGDEGDVDQQALWDVKLAVDAADDLVAEVEGENHANHNDLLTALRTAIDQAEASVQRVRGAADLIEYGNAHERLTRAANKAGVILYALNLLVDAVDEMDRGQQQQNMADAIAALRGIPEGQLYVYGVQFSGLLADYRAWKEAVIGDEADVRQRVVLNLLGNFSRTRTGRALLDADEHALWNAMRRGRTDLTALPPAAMIGHGRVENDVEFYNFAADRQVHVGGQDVNVNDWDHFGGTLEDLFNARGITSEQKLDLCANAMAKISVSLLENEGRRGFWHGQADFWMTRMFRALKAVVEEQAQNNNQNP